MINPTEEQFSEWMQRYYPPPEPQPSRQRRLSELAQQEAMLADLAQTQDPENAAIMQRMAPQPQEMQPMNTIRTSSGRTISLPSIQEQGGMSLNDLLNKTGASINDKVIIQDKGVGYRTPYGSVAGLDSNGRMWEMDKPQKPTVTTKQMKEYFEMLKAQREAQGGGVKPEFKDGQWVFPPSADAPQGRAVPVEGYTPQKDIKQEAARKRVSGTLEKISGAYKELSDLGAMVDVDKPAEENIIKRTAASAPGQLLGTFAGTKEQSVRNRINQIRPLLIQEIRQATEMGARGLDSNKELEFYLQAATDPAKDIQSNLEALKVLDNAYGLGIMNGTDATPTAPARQPAAGGNTVTLPDGRKMRFPSGAAAEAFRRKAGL